MSWFTNMFRRKQQLQQESDIGFIKVQFMTQQQKIKKDIAMDKISSMYQQINNNIMINKDNQYKVSYRQTFSFKDKTKIKVSELLEVLQGGIEFPQVYQFMNTEVESIELLMYNNKSIQPDTSIRLLDMMEQYQNDQSKVLEIIYKRTSLFKRIRIGAKKVVLSIPRLILKFVTKMVEAALNMLGLNSVYGIGMRVAKSFIAPKTLITSILGIISLFFPFLSPFLAFSKFM